MRLCKEIVQAIPKDRLPVVCTLKDSSYCGSYAWLTIKEDLSFEHRVERNGSTRIDVYTFEKMCNSRLLDFIAPLHDLLVTAKFNISKAGARKAMLKQGLEFTPKALALALCGNSMDEHKSGYIVELIGWLKYNKIKYSVDIKMREA